MNPTDIFRNYLLLEKEVVLEVENKAAATYLLKLIRTAKKRYSADMEKFGLEDADKLRDKTICMDVLEETPEGTKVKFFAGTTAPRGSKVLFKLLSVEDL